MQPLKMYILLFLALYLSGLLFSQQKIVLEAGYRSLNEYIPDRSTPQYPSCGSCDQSNFRKDSPTPGQGGYIQVTFHVKRIFIPLEIGILRWKDNMEGEILTMYYHPHVPSWWGPIQQYKEYIISYRSVSHYLNFSPGIGFNLLNPKGKFHLGPIGRFNPQFVLSRREISNSVTEHYKYYQNPPIENAYINTETYTYTHHAEDYIKFKKLHRHSNCPNFFHSWCASAGISSSGILFHSFGYSAEVGYQRQNFSRVAFGNIQQKSSFYLQFGIICQVKSTHK